MTDPKDFEENVTSGATKEERYTKKKEGPAATRESKDTRRTKKYLESNLFNVRICPWHGKKKKRPRELVIVERTS